MPQELIRDELIRLHGWDCFRSSSRDHMVPFTSGGRVLQKIKINASLPSGDVQVGVVLSDEERAARAAAQVEAARSLRQTQAEPLGIMQYFSFNVTNTNAGAVFGEPTDSETVIGIASYDGWLKEIDLDANSSGATRPAVAIRTSSGMTWFKGFSDQNFPVSSEFLAPDFVQMNRTSFADARVHLTNGKVPVYAGDEIIIVLRDFNNTPAGVLDCIGLIGLEHVILARPGSQAAESQYRVLNTAAINAARDASNNAGRLALEREKTRRAEIEAQARVKVAELAQQNKRPAGVPMNNPFNQVLLEPGSQPTLQRRAPVVPPKPILEAPPAQAEGGKGKTFVSAWTPNDNSIGYLIPDPPPGGKVNVFDGKYTIWSASGQNLGSGPVENVRTDADIPANSRISRNLGTTPSPSMQLSTFTPGEGFSPTQLVQTASGRRVLAGR